jgi:hypothetical protein
VLAALGLAACSKDTAPAAQQTAPAPPAPSVVPLDHLGPDELVEGTEKAFGVTLPRGLRVDGRFPDVIHTSGTMTVHSLVLYFRPRFQGGSVREGERSATFEHVTAPGSPPDTELMLHVSVVPGRTLVDVAATPLVHASAFPDQASRWRAEGLTPDGKILDKTHLE